jgi:hypothetical protein
MVEGLPIGVNFGKKKNRTALKLWQRAMLLTHLLTLDMRELDQSACRLSLPQPDISTVHCPPGCNRIGSSLCSNEAKHATADNDRIHQQPSDERPPKSKLSKLSQTFAND